MLFLAGEPIPAHATSTSYFTTWVSPAGVDSGTCGTMASPCASFNGAYANTYAGGKIKCLGPGEYGPVVISHSLSIICTPESASIVGGIFVSSGSISPSVGPNVLGAIAVTINAQSTDTIVLQGLDITTLSNVNFYDYGIAMLGAGKLTITDCLINGEPPVSGGQANYGVYVYAAGGSRVFIDNIRVLNNNYGIYVSPLSGSNTVFVERSLVDANMTADLFVAAGSAVALSGVTLTGSSIAIQNTSGTIISYGNNLIRNGGAPTTTSPLQ